MPTPVCVTIGDQLARYGFGEGHPFGPDRLGAFWTEAQAQGLDRQLIQCLPGSAGRELLERFHTPEYVERVISQSATGEGYLDCGDTPAFPGIYEAACTVVGSVLDAVERIMKAECRHAFVPIAGLHHARRDSAAGFCVFNDCGIAIETLRLQYGLQRIAYVDIDAHHGDGVFYSFEEDADLIFADLHEDGRVLYPGTGAAEETG
jgi:acetoin utilization protein AcuC